MTKYKALIINLALVAFSCLVLIVLTVVADRLFGLILPDKIASSSVELIFPPGSERYFETHEFAYEVKINELGIRERPVAELAGDFRIAVFGDSFTYGWGVQAQETWVRRLEEHVEQATGESVSTINLGKPGAGPPFYAALADQAIPLLKPDLVVVALLQGDDLGASMAGEAQSPQQWAQQVTRIFYPNLMRFIQDHRSAALQSERKLSAPLHTDAESWRQFSRESAQTIVSTANEAAQSRYAQLDPAIKEAFESGNLNPSLISVAIGSPHHLRSIETLEESWVPEAIEKTSAYLRHIKSVADLYQAPVLVVSVPLGAYVNQAALKNYQRVGFETAPSLLTCTGPDEAVAQACAQAEIPFLSLTEAFRAHQEEVDLYYEMDGHFTPKGHQLFAELLTPQLAPYLN